MASRATGTMSNNCKRKRPQATARPVRVKAKGVKSRWGNGLKPEIYNTWKSNNPVKAAIFEKLGLTNLFSSFIFMFLASLLFVNTLFCTRNMMRNAFRRYQNRQFRNKSFIRGLENSAVLRTEEDQKNIISHIISVFRSSGYNVYQQRNSMIAEKNRIGIFGTFLFHICILFIIVAVVYGSAGRLEGDMRLIEGQTLSEEHGNYMFINEGPFFNENHQKFDIYLEKFYPEYKDEAGTPRGPAGQLVILENGKRMKTDTVYSNHVMTYKGYTILGNVYGLAPLLILTNADGTVYSGSYVTAADVDNSGRYIASFEIGDTGLEGRLMVYMTAPLTTNIEKSDKIEQIPMLFLKIFDGKKELYDGNLRLNETVKIYDKYLGFYDIKYWSNFYVVKDDGVPIVYTGFGLIILSLIIIFFIIPKKVWVEVDNDESNDGREIYIGGRADKFRSLYKEEFCRLVDRIKERLSNGTD
jgi:cytochrome c biogenesis protein